MTMTLSSVVSSWPSWMLIRSVPLASPFICPILWKCYLHFFIIHVQLRSDCHRPSWVLALLLMSHSALTIFLIFRKNGREGDFQAAGGQVSNGKTSVSSSFSQSFQRASAYGAQGTSWWCAIALQVSSPSTEGHNQMRTVISFHIYFLLELISSLRLLPPETKGGPYFSFLEFILWDFQIFVEMELCLK